MWKYNFIIKIYTRVNLEYASNVFLFLPFKYCWLACLLLFSVFEVLMLLLLIFCLLVFVVIFQLNFIKKMSLLLLRLLPLLFYVVVVGVGGGGSDFSYAGSCVIFENVNKENNRNIWHCKNLYQTKHLPAAPAWKFSLLAAGLNNRYCAQIFSDVSVFPCLQQSLNAFTSARYEASLAPSPPYKLKQYDIKLEIQLTLDGSIYQGPSKNVEPLKHRDKRKAKFNSTSVFVSLFVYKYHIDFIYKTLLYGMFASFSSKHW